MLHIDVHVLMYMHAILVQKIHIVVPLHNGGHPASWGFCPPSELPSCSGHCQWHLHNIWGRGREEGFTLKYLAWIKDALQIYYKSWFLVPLYRLFKIHSTTVCSSKSVNTYTY